MTVVEVRHGPRAALPVADLAVLDLPDAQPVIARIGASVDPAYPNRMQHVLAVAAVCVAAKKSPCNAFARRTL